MREFTLHVYEADEVFYEGPCISLVVPTTEGQYGIQAMHENMVAAVCIGYIKYTLPDKSVHYAAVSDGLVRVEDNDVLILVEAAEHPDEIDEARARKQEEAARELLQAKQNQINYRTASAMVTRAINRLRVKNRYGREAK